MVARPGLTTRAIDPRQFPNPHRLVSAARNQKVIAGRPTVDKAEVTSEAVDPFQLLLTAVRDLSFDSHAARKAADGCA
jgi:hypothetical protein